MARADGADGFGRGGRGQNPDRAPRRGRAELAMLTSDLWTANTARPPARRTQGGRHMATLENDRILRHRGQDLYDSTGDKIGSIHEIYLDAETHAPEWALVQPRLFGLRPTFVPLRDATESGGG